MRTPEATALETIDWRNLIQAGKNLLSTADGSGSEQRAHQACSQQRGCRDRHATRQADGRGVDTSVTRTRPQYGQACVPNPPRGLSNGGENFASVFTDLQARRHSADYDPVSAFNVEDTSLWLAVAKYACAEYLLADPAERFCIAALSTIDRGRG